MAQKRRGKAAANPARAARRLKRLIEDLLAESGSQAEVARQLGISRSYVAKLLGDERTSVGQSVIDTVCGNLKLLPAYFAQEAEPATHVDFLRDEVLIRAASDYKPVVDLEWLLGPMTVSVAETFGALVDSEIAGAAEGDDERYRLLARLLAASLAKSKLSEAVRDAMEAGRGGPDDREFAFQMAMIADALRMLFRVLEASPHLARLTQIGELVGQALAAMNTKTTTSVDK